MATDALFSVDTTTVVLIVEGLIILIGVLGGWLFKYVVNNLQQQIKAIHFDFEAYKKDKDQEIKDLRDAVGNVNQNTNDINVALPSHYVSKVEFGRLVDALFGRLDSLFTKIDDIKDHVDQRLDKMNEKLDRKQDKDDV